jgi:nitrite reductase/ring-hydroxylating ferredoxin subunit
MSAGSLVLEVGDLQPGSMRAVEAGGLSVLVGNADGEWFAIENRCPHVGIPLDGGCLDGRVLECPLHGGKLDVRTGAGVAPPIRRPVRTFPVRVVEGGIAIELD